MRPAASRRRAAEDRATEEGWGARAQTPDDPKPRCQTRVLGYLRGLRRPLAAAAAVLLLLLLLLVACREPAGPKSPTTATDALTVRIRKVAVALDRLDAPPCGPPAQYAVLITGQVQRFVWRDGSGPLIAPAHPACPPAVDVFIILQAGVLNPQWIGAAPATPYAAETTEANLRAWYVARGARSVQVQFVHDAELDALLAAATFPVGKEHWRRESSRGPGGRTEAKKGLRTEADFAARYRSNLKMLYLRHLAFAAAAAAGPSYAGVTYWREDNLFFAPLAEAAFPPADSPGPEVVVDVNCGWGSYSDKIYAANRAGAAVLFDASRKGFLAKTTAFAACGAEGAATPCSPPGQPGKWQTERFLQNVLAAGGATVKKRDFRRTDVRYVAGRPGLCVPELYWECSPDLGDVGGEAYSGLRRGCSAPEEDDGEDYEA